MNGLQWTAGAPVSIESVDGSPLFGRAGVPLVEIFTADEQRARSSQAYVRSAVGARLRQVETVAVTATSTRVTQRDERSGLVVHSTVTRVPGARVVRIETAVENTSGRPIVLTAVSSLTAGLGAGEALDDLMVATADSEWLAENRWHEAPLRDRLPQLNLALHGQDGRGHLPLTSHGSWSTGEHLPVGVLTDESTGDAFAWQLESGGAWHCDISQAADGGVLSLLGPTDLEHQFAHELEPGARFDAIPVAIAVSNGGRDGALAELTRYRRWLRERRPADDALPIVYNDFMNTLMGQPSTEALLPLIAAAADAGAEVFCIDAGWFAEPALGDWWSTVGEWREAPTRFTGGLRAVIDDIHDRGMRSGLWLEPEVVGADSPAARSLPDDAFFQRFGRRVREHDRFHLDFRHPAARAHLDETVDRLVAEFGISFLKLDYNINPGAGTQWRATAAGDGLLGHARAYRQWLAEVQSRHPGLLIENCSSGAMRADYSLLSLNHLQSTSDQQDFRLYPPIAASAPASILPEQCGNWAYPSVDMSDEETVFTLVTGLAGRLYLSGFLHNLRDGQRALVRSAVELHKDIRGVIAESEPFWPLGLPGWDDDVVCLGLRHPGGAFVIVWDRRPEPTDVVVPGFRGSATEIFPAVEGLATWTTTMDAAGLRLRTVPGFTARVYSVTP